MKRDTVRTPLVSVITIFWNEELFLSEAVDSVCRQTYDHWELLLVDDGSTDESTAVAQQYAASFPGKIRYLEHDGHRNCGAANSRNLAIQNARGDYIALLDADDVWLPMKLECQVSILENTPDAGMLFGPSQYWFGWTDDQQDQERDFVEDCGVPVNQLYRPPVLLRELYPLGAGNAPCPSSLLLRRPVVAEVRGFEGSFAGDLQLYEDQAFLAKVYLKTGVFVSDECLTRYRVHSRSCCARVLGAGRYDSVRHYFLNWLKDYLKQQGIREAGIQSALRRAIRPYKYPFLFKVMRTARSMAERMRSEFRALRIVLGKQKRRWWGSKRGTIQAAPNPIVVGDDATMYWLSGGPVATTEISWAAKGVDEIEVRIHSPDGPQFCHQEPVGSQTTGPWVCDGMTFYLQDVSGGRSLSSRNTLDAVMVRVHRAGP